MPGRNYIDAFAQSLRGGLGTPKGLTEEKVKSGLEDLYKGINDAVEGYAKALEFQDPEVTLNREIIAVDRDNFSATYVVIMNDGRGDIRFPVRLNKEGIQAQQDYLSTANPQGKGWWPIDEMDDFNERLGFAILNALGIQLK